MDTVVISLPDLGLSGCFVFRVREAGDNHRSMRRMSIMVLYRFIGSSTATKLRPNSHRPATRSSFSSAYCCSKRLPILPSSTIVSFYKGTADDNPSSARMPSTLYIPIASPPTPAPSPGPFTHSHGHNDLSVATFHFPHGAEFQQFAYDSTNDFSLLNEQARLGLLNKIIGQCTLKELSHISALINPLLKRDFLRELPTELALHILSYINDLYELVRNVAGVCKHWRRLSNDDWLWRRMCQRWEFEVPLDLQFPGDVVVPGSAKRHFKVLYLQSEFARISRPPNPIATNIHPYSRINTYIRNEMGSWRNASPKPPTTDLTARHGSCDISGNGRGLDRRRSIGHQDSRL